MSGIQDTIIPNKIDASSVDGSTINLTNDNKLLVDIDYQSAIVQEMSENAMSIIQIEANGSLTPITHNALIVDTMNDANGYNNTINTTDTTAVHASGTYGGEVLQIQPDGTDLTNSTTSWAVMKTQVISTRKIIRVTLDAYVATNPSYATYARVKFTYSDTTTQTTAQQQITGTGVNDPYTFSNPDMTKDVTKIEVEGVAGNTSFAHCKINNIKAVYGGMFYVVADIGAISGIVTHTQLAVSGSSSSGATYQLGDGTNWTTVLSNNTKNTLSALSGNPTKLKIGFEVTDSASPTIKSYALKIWR